MASSPMFSFVLVDLTTDATPAAMKPAGAFPNFIAAWLEQINGPFAAAWGAVRVAFRIATGPADRLTSEVAINFRDSIPEAPGALAYHEVVNGVPDVELGVDLFASLATGAESVSVGGSHEILELMGDAGANGWKTRLDGVTADASEVCDFVEGAFAAASNGVAVSDFLYPSFFIPGAAGPWDWLNVMQSQYDVSNGYGITAQVGGEAQIGGGGMKAARAVLAVEGEKMSDASRRRKRSAYSRATRRGLRAA